MNELKILQLNIAPTDQCSQVNDRIEAAMISWKLFFVVTQLRRDGSPQTTGPVFYIWLSKTQPKREHATYVKYSPIGRDLFYISEELFYISEEICFVSFSGEDKCMCGFA